MPHSTVPGRLPATAHSVPASARAAAAVPLRRYSSSELMDGQREVEIEHGGRVYRLRITQLNKLILTA